MLQRPWYEMTEEELDDAIDEFHGGDTGATQSLGLHKFLGMTWDEYEAFLTGGVDAAKKVRDQASPPAAS